MPDPCYSYNLCHLSEPTMKLKVVITGLERAMGRTIRMEGNKQVFLDAHIIIWFRLHVDQSASVRINVTFWNSQTDYIFLASFITSHVSSGNSCVFNHSFFDNFSRLCQTENVRSKTFCTLHCTVYALSIIGCKVPQGRIQWEQNRPFSVCAATLQEEKCFNGIVTPQRK